MLRAVPFSWPITPRLREYVAWLLMLETGVLGVFRAPDLVLYSPSHRRSSLVLVGILALGFRAGAFEFVELARMGPLCDRSSRRLRPLSGWFFPPSS